MVARVLVCGERCVNRGGAGAGMRLTLREPWWRRGGAHLAVIDDGAGEARLHLQEGAAAGPDEGVGARRFEALIDNHLDDENDDIQTRNLERQRKNWRLNNVLEYVRVRFHHENESPKHSAGPENMECIEEASIAARTPSQQASNTGFVGLFWQHIYNGVAQIYLKRSR